MSEVRGEQAIGVKTGVSRWNFSPKVRADMSLPQKVVINDLSLREGRQLEGVVLGIDEYLRVAEQLEDIGVPMVQLAYMSPYDYDYLQALSKRGVKMKTETFTSLRTLEATKKAIDRILDCGFGVDLAFALSDDILLAQAGLQGETGVSVEDLRKKEIDTALTLANYVTGHRGTMNVNLQDFMRCDMDYLKQFCRDLERAGIGVITLDDIAGPAIPAVYKYCTRAAKEAAPNTPIGIHVHNDYSLALAGLLGALEGGAEVLDCGVNGYGERAGHAELAQLVVILEFLYGYDTGIHLEKLTGTARLLADIFRQPLPASAPIVGDNAFSHVTDWHWMFPAYPWIVASLEPEVVGNTSRPLMGEWAGPIGLKMKAEALGINLPDAKLRDALLRLREHMRWTKRPLSDIEIAQIIKDTLKT